MATEELIKVMLPPANESDCSHDGVQCIFNDGDRCTQRTSIPCAGGIILTPKEHDKHALKIITWRMKS